MLDYTDIAKQIEEHGNVQNLMKFFTFEELWSNHNELINKEIRKLNKSLRNNCPINKIERKMSEINLSVEDISQLQLDIYNHSYFPKATRKVNIPKGNGKFRELNISSYKDKIVQLTMKYILNWIYEPIFLNNSFGYRSRLNCHKALKRFNDIIKEGHTKYIIKADIMKYFDNINHKLLLEFMGKVIKDKYFLMYVDRFLKCGTFEDGEIKENKLGIAQGNIVSPTLGNVYLHYVLDNWFNSNIKTTYKSELIRYCDDFIICSDNEYEANLIYDNIANRLSEYGLELEKNKSKIREFGFCGCKEINLLGFNLSVNKHNSICFKASRNNLSRKINVISNRIHSFDLDHYEVSVLISDINSILRGLYGYFRYRQ